MIPLLKKGIREKKWYPIDGAIYLFQPVTITIMLFNIIMGMAYWISPEPIYASPITALAPDWFWWSFGILGYCYPMLGLILEGAPRKAYFYYLTYPIYGFTWFPVTIWGLLKHRNQSEWTHTKHIRGISITSIESPVSQAPMEVAVTEESDDVVNLAQRGAESAAVRSNGATSRASIMCRLKTASTWIRLW